MAATILITGTILILLILYFFVFPHMHLRWGATNEEVKAKLQEAIEKYNSSIK